MSADFSAGLASANVAAVATPSSFASSINGGATPPPPPANKVKLKAFVFALFLAFFFVGCGGGGGGSSSKGNGGDTVKPVEDADTSKAPGAAFDVEPRLNAFGAEIDVATFHPLKSGINATREIYTAGVGYAPPDNNYKGKLLRYDLWEYRGFSAPFATETATDGDSWTTAPKISVAADTDGDGYDEIITAALPLLGNKISLRIAKYDPDSQSFTESREVRAIDGSYLTNFVAGDFDGDGKAEFLLQVDERFYFIDDIDANFANLREPFDFSKYTPIKIAVADYNLDGKDDFVITARSGSTDFYYRHYLDYEGELNEEGFGSLTNGLGSNARYPAVASYDLNDDGLPDTVFLGWNTTNPFIGGRTEISAMAIITEADTVNRKPIFTKKGGSAETSHNDIDYEERAPKIAVTKDGAFKIIHSEGVLFRYTKGAFHSGSSNIFINPKTDLVAADINGDGIEDVVGIISTGTTTSRLISNIEGFGRDIVSLRYPTLVLPNVETGSDELALKFKEHKLQFSNPRIIAVLASPPYWAGSENDNGGTSLGSSIGKATEESQAVGMSVGIAVGTEAEVPAIGSAKVMAKVESSFHKGWTKSREITESVGDSIGVGEDLVIFSSVAYDVYYYEVVDSALVNDDNVAIPLSKASPVSVAVPRQVKTYKLEKETYNDWVRKHNNETGDTGYIIPSGEDNASAVTLGIGHTLGDPLSYPNTAKKNDLALLGNGFVSNKVQTVGTSDTGNSYISLSEAIGEGTTWNWSSSVGVETEVSGGFFAKASVEASVSVEYEGSTSTTITKSTDIEGQVPHISRAYSGSHPNSGFEWGLMSYPVRHHDQKYTVVTYWVEGD
jgi:hypothetical protein